MIALRQLDTRSADFEAGFAGLRHWSAQADAQIEARVAEILADVRARGDAAVLEYTARFDALAPASMAALALAPEEMRAAYAAITPAQRDALQAAAARIRSYHERQLEACGRSWSYRDADGTLLGQKVTPLDRVGIYVPGGKAAYPSSVLMNAVPAQVAGVGEIVMVVPTPGGERNALVLAAAHVAGVQRAFTIGGAQAVAALAYGTATIPRVDKITGPGNAYVASAKRRVFGEVGIDMIAGPSEILVIADGSTPADWVAMDLFSQAEHDELAQSLLLCPDAGYLDAVRAAIERLLPTLPRREIIRASLEGRGALILTRSMEEACELSNRIAPEHLEVSSADPAALGAAAQARRRDLPRRLHQREPGRLLRRPEPCAADVRHRPVLLAARRLRLPEAKQHHRSQRSGRKHPGADRGRTGAWRGPAGPCPGREMRLERPDALAAADGQWRSACARGRDQTMNVTPLPERIARTIRQDVQSAAGYAIQPSAGMVKLDAMENPFGLPPALQRELGERLGRAALNRYPLGKGEVAAALARHFAVPAGCRVIIGNGSDELIDLLSVACDVPGAVVLAPLPGFVMYEMSARLRGLRFVGVPLTASFELDEAAMLAAIERERPALTYIAYPNNPTGNLFDDAVIDRIVAAVGAQHGLVVFDEAYQPFSSRTWMQRMAAHPHVLVMRTLSKFGLAGVRLGYMAGADAQLIEQIEKVMPPYNVSVLNAEATLFALEHADVFAGQAALLRAERARLAAALAALPGVTVFPSDANMLLVRVPDSKRGFEGLKARGVLVKHIAGLHPLLANCLRLTVGTPEENNLLIEALKASL